MIDIKNKENIDKNNNKKTLIKIIFLLILLSLTSCNKRDIYDRQLSEQNPSYNVNTEDRYCVYFENNEKSVWDNTDYDLIELNKQVIVSLRELNINIHVEILSKEEKREVLKDRIIERERNNNFKNCDYLISYNLSTWKKKKNEFTRNACFYLKITDIKTNKLIGKYQVCGRPYSQKTQNQYITVSIQKWWEFQNSDKKRKFIMYNCTGGKCITRECNKDGCIIK